MDNPNPVSVTNPKSEQQGTSMERACSPRQGSPDSANLIHALQTPACYFNQNGEVIGVNDAWLTYAGLSVETLGQLQWIELIHAEHRYDALSKLRTAHTTSDHEVLKCRLVERHGAGRWFIVNFHGFDSGWLCTCTDIHDLKKREGELESLASMQADMLNVSVDCIKLISPSGNLLHVNRAGCRALGLKEGSGFGIPWLPLLPQDVWNPGNAALDAARKGVFSRFPGRSVVPGQDPQYWDNMLTPIVSADGKTTAILCVSREVTRERKALFLLQRSEERLAIAARLGGLGVWDYDIALDEIHCDDNWYRIFDRDPAKPITSIDQLRPMIHPEDVERVTGVGKTAEDLISSGLSDGIEYRIIRPNGEIRWLRSMAYLQHENGFANRVVGFVLDITDARLRELTLRVENQALEDEKASFRRQSLEDPLTCIPNRRYLDYELAQICRDRCDQPVNFCIVMIDIDHFKLYNDMYGHAEGDKALQLVAKALKDSCRQSDFVARYGGEEFVIIGRQITNPVPLLDGFMKAVCQLEIPHDGSRTGLVTISCGCAVFDARREHLSASWLIKQSDDALYEAKAQGRNRYVVRGLTLPLSEVSQTDGFSRPVE